MREHIPYPKIHQLRNCIKDANGYMSFFNIQDKVYEFTGTVKLHGTNASVVMDKDGDMWCQSRKRILSEGKGDNLGFYKFFNDHEDAFIDILATLKASLGKKNDSIIIYGEWCGEGIQKGVAINQLPRMFVIFDVAYKNGETVTFLKPEMFEDLSSPKDNIHNIYDFDTYSIPIDFADPSSVQNALANITDKVEAECPVGKYFDVSGIGEGVVWKGWIDERPFTFKVKGKEHSVTKVKTLAKIDTEAFSKISEFVDYAVTMPRICSAVHEIHPYDDYSSKYTGDIIRWILNDIREEESDTINELTKSVSIEERDIFKAIGKDVANRYKELCSITIDENEESN